MSILLTGGTCGCPPTSEAPSGYTNAFRYNAAGCLWLDECELSGGFNYLHGPRADTPAINMSGVPLNAPGVTPLAAVKLQTSAIFRVNNTTSCPIGLIYGYDTGGFILARADLGAYEVRLGFSLNGVVQPDTSACRTTFVNTPTLPATPIEVTTPIVATANPIGGAVSDGPGPRTTLAPGAGVDVQAFTYIIRIGGAAAPVDAISSLSSIIRIYAHKILV